MKSHSVPNQSSSNPTKYIFVTGGVASSLGKGIAAASIAALLEARGLKISMLKLDPYINVDPGTMSPYQHGEVYVTDDGAETDLDLGHYERYTESHYSRKNSITAGKIYFSVITKERRGEYLGQTVQVIPHITDEIKHAIREAAQGFDVLICEIGGTVGDIESLPFIEAIRQMRFDEGLAHTLYVHLTLVPYIRASGEVKTKPTQHSVQKLREIGVQPDLLLCRSEEPLGTELKNKIALFTNVQPPYVIDVPDVDTVYAAPLWLHEQGLDAKICERLGIWTRQAALGKWRSLVENIRHPKGEVSIGVVGKYIGLKESYKSLVEALLHAGVESSVRVNIEWIDAADVESKGSAALSHVDGVLVPGGFGERGIEGKIEAVRLSREKQLPFFGICLGMQIAVIEFARNVCELKGASSVEFNAATAHPLICLMDDQRQVTSKGGTMRLGAFDCALAEDSLARATYHGKALISERHRHRYEVNTDYRAALTEKGLILSGLSPDGKLVEMVELKGHPWFLGCQFHPEFKSKPFAPHPLFVGFVRAAVKHRIAKNESF